MAQDFTAEAYRAANRMQSHFVSEQLTMNELKALSKEIWERVGSGPQPLLMTAWNWNDRVRDGRVGGEGAHLHEEGGDVMAFQIRITKRGRKRSWIVIDRNGRNMSTLIHELAHALQDDWGQDDGCSHGGEFLRAEQFIYNKIGLGNEYREALLGTARS